MIFLDPSKVKEPAWFRSNECAEIRLRLVERFAMPVDERPQIGREFFPIAGVRVAARDALFKWTHGKCAYCESPLHAQPPKVEMFRPLRVDDAKARDHYWWLATEWNNLLLSCAKCNTAKRNLFPIDGNRCRLGAIGDELLDELPLLIDPSRDRPERELIVMRDGSLFPVRTSNALPTRGLVTIEVLQLNRTDLVRLRLEVTRDVARLAHQLFGDLRGKSVEHFGGLESRGMFTSLLLRRVDSTHPFAAAARSELARQLIDRGIAAPERVLGRRIGTLVNPYIACIRDADRIESAMRSEKPDLSVAYKMQLPRTLDAVSAPRTVPDFSVDRVRRVTLESFRAIRKIDFELPLERPRDLVSAWRERLQGVVGMDDLVERREWGWKMLLGENGAGKSSIVQAIAIALMGQEFWEKRRGDYGLDHSLRTGATRGLIRVELEESEPVEITITKRGLVWRKRPEGVPVFLRGYGATRLLPRRGATGDARTSGAPPAPIARAVDSLFDPHAPLIDAEAWLRSLGEHDFHAAATNLKALLDLPEREADFGFEERSSRKGRFGLWRSRGKRRFAAFEPLDHFSAGYQTLLALGCDVMAGSGRTIGETRELPGIVLLDEIGTNLHPRWRLAIVRRLGNCFPRMQFIASTHEPLCLRGLGEREVAVVRRVQDEVTVQDDLPSPAGLRVDQLLTSPYFGLDTTSDPAMQRATDVYYQLVSRGDALHADEQRLLDELRVLLDTAQLLGSTRREQLLLTAVDQAVAEERLSAKGRPLVASKELRDVARRMLGTLGPTRARRPRSRR